MDAAYLHLLVNHFPVVLSVVGALAAVLSVFTRHRSTWTFALTALLLAGLTVYPAFYTGDGAEHVMEKVWYVDRALIHEHEESAELALWLALATGVLAAFAMWRERTAFTGGRKVLAAPGWLRALVAVAALLSAAAIARTSWTAGFIVHKAEKLRTAPAGAEPTPAPVAPPVAPAPAGASTGVMDTSAIRPPVR